MAQDRNISENAMEGRAFEHKGSSVALSNAKWYIAECKPTRERTIREMLKKVGYDAYVASQKEKHRYGSGNVRVVEHVILPGRVFVHTDEASLVDIMTSFSSVYRFQINRASSGDKCGVKPFAYVPSDDMERLMALLDKASNPVFITRGMLRLDQEVRIVRGPLAGFEGYFYRESTATYIVIRVKMGTNHYAYTEVAVSDIAIIQNE